MEEEYLNPKSIRRKSLFAFLFFIVMMSLIYFTWKWVYKQPKEQGTFKPLRKVLETNEKIFSNIFDSTKLVKEYPVAEAVKKVRVNGMEGLRSDVDTVNWKLNVIKTNGDTLKLSIDEIKSLPKKDIVFDFKCIEGWSQVTHWAGVPLSTFLKHYHLDKEKGMKFIGLETPDKAYYVGIDMPSAVQPQTILCYEMNGKPLPLNQGFPLRLIIPVKYGVKHLKRIGTMFFSNNKPADYWAERGYDYYTGH